MKDSECTVLWSGIAGLARDRGSSRGAYPAPLADGGGAPRGAYPQPVTHMTSFNDSFVKVDYPAYPVLTPTSTSVAPVPVPQLSCYGSGNVRCAEDPCYKTCGCQGLSRGTLSLYGARQASGALLLREPPDCWVRMVMCIPLHLGFMCYALGLNRTGQLDHCCQSCRDTP
jgi:hypothetical protein